MYSTLQADLLRKHEFYDHHSGRVTRWMSNWSDPGSLAVIVYRFGNWAFHLRNPVARQLILLIYLILKVPIVLCFGIYIPVRAKIGKGFVIQNMNGVFISTGVIGENCTVQQGVTIGAIRPNRWDGKPRPPALGNNVCLEAGVKVLGDVKIGNNVTVCANSVVLTDVPDNVTVMGIPARVVAKNEPVKQPEEAQESLPEVEMPRIVPLIDFLKADLDRKRELYHHHAGRFTRWIKNCIDPGALAVIVYRIGSWGFHKRNPVARFFILLFYRILKLPIVLGFGIYIPARANIGKGFIVHNMNGIFISPGVIGENCTVQQGVTIGVALSNQSKGLRRPPKLGNNVYLGAGSKVQDDVTIGNNVVVGANSVVTTDIPDNVTVMGIPARIVARNRTDERAYGMPEEKVKQSA